MQTGENISDRLKSESRIQQEIVREYRNRNLGNESLIFSVPNDTKNKQERIRKHATGLLSGVADLIIVKHSTPVQGQRTIFIEVKDNDGTQTKEQKEFERGVKVMGYEYHIVRSVEEFNKLGL